MCVSGCKAPIRIANQLRRLMLCNTLTPAPTSVERSSIVTFFPNRNATQKVQIHEIRIDPTHN
jgi:hypothetical protein